MASFNHADRRLPRLVVLLALAVPAALTPTATAENLVLVEHGQPRAVLVVDPSPSAAARSAAATLQNILAEATGAKLEILPATALGRVTKQAEGIVAERIAPPMAFVLVGSSKLTADLGFRPQDVPAGGVRIAARGNVLAMYGADDLTPVDKWGTLYAAITFLEEHVGCRQLWPGALGRVVPRRATLAVPTADLAYDPPIRQRKIRDYFYNDRLQLGLDRLQLTKDEFVAARIAASRTGNGQPDWFVWNRIGGSMGLKSGHAFSDYWEKYGQEHPDWFALQPTGTRDQSPAPDRARFCVTNAGLLDQIARDKIAELDANPAEPSVSICPNDGGPMTFCVCENCKRLDPPEGRKIELHYRQPTAAGSERKTFEYVSLTDRYVWFYNQLAERVTKARPAALLVGDAYSAYSAPPVKALLHPSVVIRFVPGTYLSEQKRALARADWDAWSRAASKIFYRPNSLLAGRQEGTLLVYAFRFAEDFHRVSAGDLIGTDFDSCAHNWATQGLNYYVAARLLWNPSLAAEAIVDDYCTAGFGPAAGAVKAYFARVEQLTDAIAQQELATTAPFTPAVVAELGALLARAEQAATGDTAILGRIAFLRRGLVWTDAQARAYALLAEGKRGEAATRLLDERLRLARELFLRDHLAVNVAYVAWGEGRLWKKLGWRWPGEP